MKIEFDAGHDIAYVSLKPTTVKKGEAVHQSHGNFMMPEPWQKLDTPVTLIFDWDAEGRMLGFEVSPATMVLPPEALKK